jgi:hypothetical protein
MLTSSLDPLPSTRWLSMSIAYNDLAPANYEAPEFVPQDSGAMPKFAGEEPLMIGIGEVDTGFQTVSLVFRQAVPEEEQRMECTQQVDDTRIPQGSGYDSDNTEQKWAKDKKEMIAMAERIAQNAAAQGKSPEVAVRGSEMGKTLPESTLSEILAQLNITGSIKKRNGKPAANTEDTRFKAPDVPSSAKRMSRVKRPLQQITTSAAASSPKRMAVSKSATDESIFETQDEAPKPVLKKRAAAQTFSKRH